MAPESQFLEGQLGLYGEQSEKSEQWKSDHDKVKYCWEIEDAIEFGLSIITSINRLKDRWAFEIEKEKGKFSWEDSKKIASYYKWWLKRTKLLLSAVKVFEDFGFTVVGADKLREEYREVSLLPLNVNAVKKSVHSLEQGHGIPLSQALDGLRNCPR